MSDRRWKRLEREVAAKVGGQRVPVTGERDGADITHPVFAYQVKSRRALPAWLWTWLAGITGTATRQGKTGVLVLHQPGQELDDAVVCVRFRDWQDLHGV